MNDERLDRAFAHSGDILPAALAAKIRARIQADTQPVKLMPSGPVCVFWFAAIFGLVSTLFASLLGFRGLHLLSTEQTAEFLSALLVLTLASGAMAARGMRPGSGSLHSWLLGGVALAVYDSLVIFFFKDYSTAGFVPRGVVCLLLGVACALIAAVPIWLIVRRGFVVEPVQTGAIVGLVAGLAGLLALTLHCTVLTTPHAAVWHAGVVVICVAAGAIAGRVAGHA
jgi:hypothetical protein